MHLVDEEHRAEQAVAGALHHLAGIGDAAGHGRELDQLGVHGVGEQMREGGLAGAGGTPQMMEGRLPPATKRERAVCSPTR